MKILFTGDINFRGKENLTFEEQFGDGRLFDDLLSFDTQEKTIDIETIQIEEENSFKQVEKIIKDFRKVIA